MLNSDRHQLRHYVCFVVIQPSTIMHYLEGAAQVLEASRPTNRCVIWVAQDD